MNLFEVLISPAMITTTVLVKMKVIQIMMKLVTKNSRESYKEPVYNYFKCREEKAQEREQEEAG